MERTCRPGPGANARGSTLVELCVALIILAIGLLTLGQLIPAGSRSSLQSHIRTDASFYAQQKIEQLGNLGWNDPSLAIGRHPAGAAFDTLNGGECLRFYNVDQLPAPLDNLKRVSVTVRWNYMGQRSITDTTYFRL